MYIYGPCLSCIVSTKVLKSSDSLALGSLRLNPVEASPYHRTQTIHHNAVQLWATGYQSLRACKPLGRAAANLASQPAMLGSGVGRVIGLQTPDSTPTYRTR